MGFWKVCSLKVADGFDGRFVESLPDSGYRDQHELA
jgi:hypothetical protein